MKKKIKKKIKNLVKNLTGLILALSICICDKLGLKILRKFQKFSNKGQIQYYIPSHTHKK